MLQLTVKEKYFWILFYFSKVTTDIFNLKKENKKIKKILTGEKKQLKQPIHC